MSKYMAVHAITIKLKFECRHWYNINNIMSDWIEFNCHELFGLYPPENVYLNCNYLHEYNLLLFVIICINFLLLLIKHDIVRVNTILLETWYYSFKLGIIRFNLILLVWTEYYWFEQNINRFDTILLDVLLSRLTTESFVRRPFSGCRIYNNFC